MSKSMKNTFKGVLIESGYNDVLYLDTVDEPIIETFYELFHDSLVTIKYWISESKKTKEELILNDIRKMYGIVNADYCEVYSEYTGYLWTDEKLIVGGHNLRDELYSYIGSYLYLEVEIHEKKNNI